MIPDILRKILENESIDFNVISHPPTPTAQETAQSAHISGRRFAKTVLLRARGSGSGFVLAVLPASEVVDLPRLGSALGFPVELASEAEFARLFPDYEVGAAPPFGWSADVPVVVDSCLEDQGSIAFNAGTHRDVIDLRWGDFVSLVTPTVLDFGNPRLRHETTPLWG